MKFESDQDCAFSAEVSFPEEEKYQARKRQAEQQSANLFQRSATVDDDEILDEDDLLLQRNGPARTKEGRLNVKLVAQFKKKMAREVRNLVDDKSAARDFLANVSAVKLERKKRNIRAMISASCNPDKEQVDFVKSNIGEAAAEAHAADKREGKLRALLLKEARQLEARLKRERLVEEKQKKSVMQLFRNQLLRAVKEGAMGTAEGIKRQSFRMRLWLRLVLARGVVERLFANF